MFFIFELYVNEAAWGAHEATDHFKAAVAQLLPTVTRRERVPFIPFLLNAGGDAAWLGAEKPIDDP